MHSLLFPSNLYTESVQLGLPLLPLVDGIGILCALCVFAVVISMLLIELHHLIPQPLDLALEAAESATQVLVQILRLQVRILRLQVIKCTPGMPSAQRCPRRRDWPLRKQVGRTSETLMVLEGGWIRRRCQHVAGLQPRQRAACVRRRQLMHGARAAHASGRACGARRARLVAAASPRQRRRRRGQDAGSAGADLATAAACPAKEQRDLPPPAWPLCSPAAVPAADQEQQRLRQHLHLSGCMPMRALPAGCTEVLERRTQLRQVRCNDAVDLPLEAIGLQVIPVSVAMECLDQPAMQW
mmetsp:Transcript_58586/g.171452  ORF Transcript_58586/g.171452 Transcript_58586/m.171452 type:complete len:298 (-) Transcript_58586:2287-3180(-)